MSRGERRHISDVLRQVLSSSIYIMSLWHWSVTWIWCRLKKYRGIITIKGVACAWCTWQIPLVCIVPHGLNLDGKIPCCLLDTWCQLDMMRMIKIPIYHYNAWRWQKILHNHIVSASFYIDISSSIWVFSTSVKIDMYFEFVWALIQLSH